MIDLTPLDVRNKRGDFKRIMRGYDPAEVDIFLELAAERLEVLVRENLQLRERTQTLQNQVDAQVGREQAVQEALVTAQELRSDIQAQSQREADHVLREADAEAKRLIAEAEAEARRLIAEAEAEVRSRLRGIERQLDQARDSMDDLERRRARFLKEFRSLLEREFDVVNVEEERTPFEDRAIDLDLGPRGGGPLAEAPPVARPTAPAPPAVPPPGLAAPPATTDVPETAEATEAVVVPDTTDPAAAPAENGDPEPESPAPGVTDEARAGGDAEPGPGATDVAEATADAPPAADLPQVDVAALQPDTDAGGDRPSTPPADTPLADAPPTEPPTREAAVDVAPPEGPTVEMAELEPEASALTDEPSTLELELMAGAASAADASVAERYPDVPDLETLLAEAGVEELRPTAEQDIAPPPAPGVSTDNLILFDPNDPDRKR